MNSIEFAPVGEAPWHFSSPGFNSGFPGTRFAGIIKTKDSEVLEVNKKFSTGGQNVSGVGKSQRNDQGTFHGPGEGPFHPDHPFPGWLIGALFGHGSG